MFHSKKGQSLSMQTIIIAALALLVLAIVALIFINKINDTNEQLNSCEKGGGVCLPVADANSCNEYTRMPNDNQYAKYYGRTAQEHNLPCINALGNVDTSKRCCIIV